MNKSGILFALLVFLSALPVAHALEATVIGGINSASSTQEYTTTSYGSSSSAKFFFGGFLEVGMMPGFSLETGLEYLPRKYSIAYASGSNEYQFNNLVIPVLFRVTLLPMISFGVGPYYMMGTGQVTGTTTSAGGTASAVVTDFDTSGSGLKKSEIGLQANARASFSIMPLVAGVIDFRYDMSLTNRSYDTTSITSWKDKDLSIGAGLSFGF